MVEHVGQEARQQRNAGPAGDGSPRANSRGRACERSQLVVCSLVLLLCALNPALLPAWSLEAIGAHECWGASRGGRGAHFDIRLRGGGSGEKTPDILLLDGDDDDAAGAPGFEIDQQEDTLELQLQHDAAAVGDAQSLCDYAGTFHARTRAHAHPHTHTHTHTHTHARTYSTRWAADFLQTANRDLATARKLYARALQLEPASVRTHCSFGRLLHSSEQLDAAERHYNAALLLNPMDVDTLSCSAVLAQSRQDLGRAAAFYEKVLEVVPSSAHTHSNYATLLLEIEHAARRGSPQYACNTTRQDTSSYQHRAEWHLRQAIALNPGDTHALYNYAVVQQELHGNALDAAQALIKVLKLNPTDPDASYNFAVTQLAISDILMSEGIKLLQDQQTAGHGHKEEAEAAAAEEEDNGGDRRASQLAAELTRVRTAMALFRRAEEVAPGRRVQVCKKSPSFRVIPLKRDLPTNAYLLPQLERAESAARQEMPVKELICQMQSLLPKSVTGAGTESEPQCEVERAVLTASARIDLLASTPLGMCPWA